MQPLDVSQAVHPARRISGPRYLKRVRYRQLPLSSTVEIDTSVNGLNCQPVSGSDQITEAFSLL